MKRFYSVRKAAPVVSAVLLIGGFIAWKAGAFEDAFMLSSEESAVDRDLMFSTSKSAFVFSGNSTPPGGVSPDNSSDNKKQPSDIMFLTTKSITITKPSNPFAKNPSK